MHVERLKKENFEELLDFIDLVFSQHFAPIHFREDIPYAFMPTDERMQYQYVVREQGRIVSAIGVIPYVFRIGQETFQARTVTNVATHYRSRGRGYMQALMKQAFQEMERDSVDFALLTGPRERYRYLGFESAGTTCYASYNTVNAHNYRATHTCPAFRLQPVTEADTPLLEQIVQKYQTLPMGYLRTGDTLLTHTGLYQAKTYGILDDAGQLAGYLVYNRRYDNVITEIVLDKPEWMPPLIYSLMETEALTEVRVAYDPLDLPLNAIAYETAEELTTRQTCRLKLLKPERLIAACLNSKQRLCGPLPQGTLVLDSCLGKLEIRNRGQFQVHLTDRPADVALPGHQIYPLLFGPGTQALPGYYQIPTSLQPWFPVHFHIPRTEVY